MKAGTVLENSQWKVKVYSPPREHGAPHVHVIAKGHQAEVKIFLEDLSVVGSTKFSKKSVHQNYELLIRHWEALHGQKKKT